MRDLTWMSGIVSGMSFLMSKAATTRMHQRRVAGMLMSIVIMHAHI